MKKFLVLLIVSSLILTLVGCASNSTSTKPLTPIPEETLSYFKDLENKTLWPVKSSSLELVDSRGRSVTLLSGKPPRDWHISFLGADVRKKDKDGKPLLAVLLADVYTTKDSSKSYEFLVNEANEKALKAFLPSAETNKQRYDKTIALAKQYITKGKWNTAIATIQNAISYDDTPEAESLLDSVYYYKARSYYKIGNYGEALVLLENVKYNKSWIKEAQKLKDSITAIKKAKLDRIRKQMEVEKDEFKETTFYTHYGSTPKYLQKGKIYLYPYIGVDKTHKWYFLRLEMYLDSWIFAKKVYAIVGNQHFETPSYDMFSKYVTQKVVSDGVYEQIDFPDSDDATDLLVRSIVNAPLGTKIKFRVEGKDSYKEFVMTKSEQQLWKDVMYFYDYGINKPSS